MKTAVVTCHKQCHRSKSLNISENSSNLQDRKRLYRTDHTNPNDENHEIGIGIGWVWVNSPLAQQNRQLWMASSSSSSSSSSFSYFFCFFRKSTSHGKSTINWPSSAASKNLIPRVPRVVHWKKSPSCGSGRRSRRYVTNFAGFQKQVVISNTCYPLLSKICETCCNTNTCHCFCRV